MKATLGDEVTWMSQSQAYRKTKSGKVVAIVPAGEDPHKYLPEGCRPIGDSFGMPRKHESYLVQVGNSKRMYWPRINHLQKAGTQNIASHLPLNDANNKSQ